MSFASGKNILLVEGRDDREVVYQICNHYKVDNRCCFDVNVKDGYERLRTDLRVRLRSSVDVVAAIVDADDDIAGRWCSLRDLYRKLDYQQVPDVMPTTGLILEHDRYPRAGLWMMPDNQISGMLESFIEMLVSSSDALLPRARKAIKDIPNIERRFKPSYVTKAVVHTWLAWQEEPGTALGQAFTKRYLNENEPVVLQFVQWLRDVFGISN